MEYIAHRIPETGEEQSVLEHLTQTAKLAAAFAESFGASQIAYRCGLLHDVGKYSAKFQRRIRGAEIRVDHSTAGALEANALRDPITALCICGHHGGLPDLGSRVADSPESATFCGRLKRKVGVDIEPYDAFRTEVTVPAAAPPVHLLGGNANSFFFAHMLYSCLVDADFLDTEHFMAQGGVQRGAFAPLDKYLEELESYIDPWWDAKTELNKRRCAILRALIDGADAAKGLFTLTVPTGGGKTISSMAFALKHALKHGMKRIIYVIPYTSIIEQTQDVFEKVFGVGNVVAHYANVQYNSDENGRVGDKRYLAAENWDAPVIITTNVQFFESLFANRSSSCRKLHNIAQSVLIFDEAQMLPVPYLKPCVYAISQLVQSYGCSAVLCTATQPALTPLFKEYLPQQPIRELCPQVQENFTFFKRTRFEKCGVLSDEALAQRLGGEKQVLCVVNNRKQAQALYKLLPQEGSHHLSTTMTPEHRRAVIKEIRQRLKDGLPCRVVSTSLIEAGVDLDFPVAYRALAGLDSMIQAAGRCNREGKRPLDDSVVYLFDTEQKPPQMLEQNIAAARRVLEQYEDITAPDAIKAYFDFLLYTLKDASALDLKQIMQTITGGTMPFAQIANAFRIIESAEYTLYVPRDEQSRKLVEKLRRGEIDRSLMRTLGQYAVGVYPWHFRELDRTGAVERVPAADNAAILLDGNLYSDRTGLSFGVNEGQGLYA